MYPGRSSMRERLTVPPQPSLRFVGCEGNRRTELARPSEHTFGDSPRNVLFGPRSHQLNANFTRDVRLPGNRNVSIVATATNLLNTVNYAGLDTNVNSSTFGEITSVRPLRTIRFNLRFRF